MTVLDEPLRLPFERPNLLELFDQDDAATVVVLGEHPTPDQEPDAEDAATGCPVRAIVLHRGD